MNYFRPLSKIVPPKWSRLQRHYKKSNVIYDCVIVGGGIVGAAAAASLAVNKATMGMKIMLIEGSNQLLLTNLPSIHSNQVCALSPSSINLLKTIRAWDIIAQQRFYPVQQMKVWNSSGHSTVSFGNEYDVVTPLAHIVENNVILSAINVILNELNQNSQINLQYGTRIQDIEIPYIGKMGGHVPLAAIKLMDGRIIQTRLVIGADGARSVVRNAAFSNVVQWSYDSVAIVATLQLEHGCNDIAWQRFLPDSTIAMLPLGNGQSSLTWYNRPSLTNDIVTCSEKDFVSKVNYLFHTDFQISSFLNSITDCVNPAHSLLSQRKMLFPPPKVIELIPKSRASFPLSFFHSVHYCKDRIVIIGDAAHRIHPLCGQGLNLGLGDVGALTNHLQTIVKSGGDIGSVDNLLSWESERQAHNVSMQLASEFIYGMYDSSSWPLMAARDVIVNMVSDLDLLKTYMIKFASM